jgi:putative flippase GtrA
VPIATTRASRGLVFNQPTNKKISYQKRKIVNHHALKSMVAFFMCLHFSLPINFSAFVGLCTKLPITPLHNLKAAVYAAVGILETSYLLLCWLVSKAPYHAVA